MKTHSFTLVVAGLDPDADDFEDRFFEAGCDDATISVFKGSILLDFEREAKSFLHAVASAIGNVGKAGATVVRIEPDHLVSLSDIAERTGLTRAAVSLFSQGKRGRDFPPPVARITADTPLWDWEEVARWLYRHARRPEPDRGRIIEARVVKTINRAIGSGNLDRTSQAGALRRMLLESTAQEQAIA